MKEMSLWRRLQTAQLALVILLMIGVGLEIWAERRSAATRERNLTLSAAKDRVYFNMIGMSAALRGLLLDPNTDNEGRRRDYAVRDVLNTLDELLETYRGQVELVQTLNALRDFVVNKLDAFERRVLTTAATDPREALQLYLKTYAQYRVERDQVFSDFNIQVQRTISDDSDRAKNTALIGLGSVILILAASFLVGRFQSTTVSRPLKLLVDALERMRRGDFTERLPLHRRDDEFGVLGEGFNRLAEDLSALVGQVQRSGIQVNTTATEIAATAREQQSTTNQIAATTAQIGATSKEISATSKELVATMNEVAVVAEDTATVASDNQHAIAKMESTMRHIMDASSAITGKLAVLNEKSANINTLVTTITKVADQTNLLSLNAAIEAEKAGEYGLGFAVVAMEIRRLADQTAVATYDIEKMVKEMQSAVAAGVMGMDKFSEEVRRGVEEIRQVSTQLAQIIHQVQTLTPRFQTVNEGMHAQATGAQQISETLTQLSEAAHQTAESLRQSNLSIEQLNEAARGLQTSVARFKLHPD